MIHRISNSEEETQYPVTLLVRDSVFGVQLDCRITPLYCMHCEKQVDGLFGIGTTENGQIGSIDCSCGAQVHCTVGDHIVDYIDTLTVYNGSKEGKYYIDFKKIYRLDKPDWHLLKNWLGFDIIRQYKGKSVNLDEVCDFVSKTYNIKVDELRLLFSESVFSALPASVQKWHALLERVEEKKKQ